LGRLDQTSTDGGSACRGDPAGRGSRWDVRVIGSSGNSVPESAVRSSAANHGTWSEDGTCNASMDPVTKAVYRNFLEKMCAESKSPSRRRHRSRHGLRGTAKYYRS